MVKKSLVAAMAVGLAASLAQAEVTFHLSPDTIMVNEPTDLIISVTSNPGLTLQIGGVGFDFNPNSAAWAALNPSGFEWIPADMNDPNLWFVSSDLPSPIAVSFGPGVPVPDGVEVDLAGLHVNPGTLGTFSLALGVNNLSDQNALPLDLKGGDPSPITIIPEPASLCLLALGALAIVRRSRR